MRILDLLLSTLLGSCLAACSSHDPVARSTSPDGAIDAIVVESNSGATTSFSYDVCLAPHGASCTAASSLVQLYGATRSDQAYGVNVRWANASLIKVEYLEAQRVKVLHPTTAILDRTVTVALQPGIIDPSAPPGGMLYNLQGRPQDAP